MQVRKLLERVNFRIGTMDDVSGRSVNPIVKNRIIIDELNNALSKYAQVTKGITDVYSFPLNVNTPFVAAPPLALRSESYYYLIVIVTGTIYPMDMRSPRDVYPIFRNNPIQGISNWVMPWGAGGSQFLTMYPMLNTTALTTTISADISVTATTIPVASSTSFINNHGRITIDSEKILYQYKDTTNFYGCQRGVESTTAATHTSGTTVSENNVILYYSRLPTPITVTADNFIDESVLNMELEPPEEHMEGIIKATAYPLVLKIDADRAEAYRVEAEGLYAQYKAEIAKGYYRGRMGTGIRDAWSLSEGGSPHGANLIY
jgi:hypothetical protein